MQPAALQSGEDGGEGEDEDEGIVIRDCLQGGALQVESS
jgi:hypothetical protein